MPTLAIKPFDPKTPNQRIIEAIRHEASSEYQRRIPDAIKSDVSATLRELNNYTPAMNEFIAALVNKIGLTIARNNSWTNPLAMYKKGLLEYGDTVEEIQTGLIQGYVFDPRREYGEKALFGKHIPEVQTSYHTINRESMYPLTVQRSTIQRAFTSESGLSEFITQLMQAATTSDNWDEYLLMVRLLTEFDDNGGFFKVHVNDIASADSTSEDSRQTLRTLREFAETIPFLSTRYNAAHMPVSANPEDLILITTPAFKSGLDVNALAAMFNVSYGEVPYKTHTIPKHDMPTGVEAVLTTKDFFQVYDTYFDTASQPNAAGRSENFILHHDQIISASRFVPAIGFTTGEGDVIEIVDEPVTGMNDIVVRDSSGATVTSNVRRGESYLVEVAAITAGDNDAAILSMTGAQSQRTYLTQTGTMHVAVDDKATSLVVTATAQDGDATKTRTLTVVGDLVEFWPNPSVQPDADSDGLNEVTPEEPAFEDDTITIPNVTGVQYKVAGTDVVNNSTHVITEATTVTAVARAGKELAAGATASWTFTPAA